MNAAEQAAPAVLRVPVRDPSLPGFYTVMTDEGDALVARWNGSDSARPESAVWVWDTPFETTFVLQLPVSVLQTDVFVRYCEGLLRWQKPPDLSSLRLTYLRTGEMPAVVGAMEYISGQMGNATLWFAGMGTKDGAFVGLGVAKARLSRYYPPAANGVPERFPPLRSRLGSLSTESLYGELGKGYKDRYSPTYPENRDAIILREIAARGPISPERLRYILIEGLPGREQENQMVMAMRFDAFLTAVREEKQTAAYLPQIKQFILETAVLGGWTQDLMAGRMFLSAESSHIDCTQTALHFLEKGKAQGQSLFYLEQHGQGAEAAGKLAQITVRSDLAGVKESAVRRIRERAGQGARPPAGR